MKMVENMDDCGAGHSQAHTALIMTRFTAALWQRLEHDAPNRYALDFERHSTAVERTAEVPL